MAKGIGKAGARLVALAQIVAAIAALFVTSGLIGAFVVPYVDQILRMPVLALAMWGAVFAGGVMLHLSKSSYGTIGLTLPKNWMRCLGWAVAAIVLAQGGALVIGEVVRRTTDWPPLDVAYIRHAIEGNLGAYLIWVVVVVWGSAAFGEELLARGFIMEKFQVAAGRGAIGIVLAIFGQAIIFGGLHAVQGITGVIITGYVGVVLGAAYFASGRNILAPILAHGVMDTLSLTMMYLHVSLPGYIN